MSEIEKNETVGEKRSSARAVPPYYILSTLAVALAAMWLYSQALTFAYFNDDPTGHFAWMEGRTPAQFFSSSAEYGYYRPIVFTVLRLFENFFGNSLLPHNPVADHALLVALHGANTALLWVLARRLSGRAAFAWVAALVFAFGPFHYEAVAYVASLTHPLLVFWVISALLLFDRGRQTTSRRYYLGSGAAMVMGLLTHENGLIIFPALAGLDWVARPKEPLRRRARFLWPFAIPPVLFVALWLIIPKNSDQGLNSLADMGRNLVPFLQTLVYPLLPALRLDAGDVWLLALAAAGIVSIFGFMAWRGGALRLWLFALGWFALASLPALLFLTPAYVYGSPRLSYLSSIGVALLWALPAVWPLGSSEQRSADSGRRSFVHAALLLIYTLVLILPPLPFIRCQLDFYAETSRMARALASATAAAPAGSQVVVVNAPFFFSSFGERPGGCPNPYPWTPVGGILIPPYAAIRDFVRFNGGPDRDVSGVTFVGYHPGWRTFGPEIGGEAMRRLAAEDSVLVFDLSSGLFADLSTYWRPDAIVSTSSTASFGEVLQLSAVDLEQDGDSLAVALDWRVAGLPKSPLATFVHVYDEAGTLVGQSDGPPGAGLAPQDLWQPGDAVADRRRVDLSTLPPGGYTVAVGVYNPLDGVRLAAEAAGQALTDNVLTIGSVER